MMNERQDESWLFARRKTKKGTQKRLAQLETYDLYILLLLEMQPIHNLLCSIYFKF